MKKNIYSLSAELTLHANSTLLVNSKRIELLRQIGLTENLTKSAKISGYSYKGAWDAIEKMSQITGGSLLDRQAGGKGGGKTRLTENGKQLLKNFLLIQEEHSRFIARLNRIANNIESDYSSQTEVAMQTSARNQFAGIIESILQGPVSDEITIIINDQHRLCASITHESSRDLKLEIGAKVFALIKASFIKLGKNSPLANNEQKNIFDGIVHKTIPGLNKTEVVLTVSDNLHLVCTLPNSEVSELLIDSADKVFTSIDPTNIIIGVAA